MLFSVVSSHFDANAAVVACSNLLLAAHAANCVRLCSPLSFCFTLASLLLTLRSQCLTPTLNLLLKVAYALLFWRQRLDGFDFIKSHPVFNRYRLKPERNCPLTAVICVSNAPAITADFTMPNVLTSSAVSAISIAVLSFANSITLLP